MLRTEYIVMRIYRYQYNISSGIQVYFYKLTFHLSLYELGNGVVDFMPRFPLNNGHT